MSMNLSLKRVSDADIRKLNQMPEGIHAFIEEEVEDRGAEYAAARAALAKSMGLDVQAAKPEALPDFDDYPFVDQFEADKLWHGLHFLLTGMQYGGELPAAYLLDGEPIGQEDVGYGPARAIDAATTVIFSSYLDALSRSEFLDRLAPDRMTALNIYPQIWDEDPADLKEALGEVFDRLRGYCRKCATHGLGMICFIT